MTGAILTVVVLVLIVVGVVWLVHRRAAAQARELEDARSDARRWVERLGGQVLDLVGTDEASRQAIADAAERATPRRDRRWTRSPAPHRPGRSPRDFGGGDF